jgi:class 3 adenylate cyclase/HAMP domain-containing protein
MSIRSKMVAIVLPLIVAPLLVTGVASSLAARNGITRIATSFLRFKMDDLLNYAASQWSLLEENGLSGNPEYVTATKSAVSSFARSLVRGSTELILAVDREGRLAMSTGELELSAEESRELARLAAAGISGWRPVGLGGAERVAQLDSFRPFGWYLLVTERRETFYQTTSQIFVQTGLILTVSLLVAVLLLLFFSYYITKPLRLISGAMRDIIQTRDMSRRVDLLYRDETGDLGHSFNLMTGELDKAYQAIKEYALKAVVAHSQVEKIRTIFQRYVPRHVIDQYYKSPESMLVPGKETPLVLLFSDVRSFTTISESMLPSEVVETLNAYFEKMVRIVFDHGGFVDKYMGDGLMAVFGAPARKGDEPLQAVLSGFEMLDALESFNEWHTRRGRKPFRIGIGINYGMVTVGNIGSDKKMDYTVIGDQVNVSSRLEGLTKKYQESLLISESVMKKLDGKFPCRLIDRVVPKGKSAALAIGVYVPRRQLGEAEAQAWALHEEAMSRYYKRQFREAQGLFRKVQGMLPGDRVSARFVERCQACLKRPPGPEWTGAVIMTEK